MKQKVHIAIIRYFLMSAVMLRLLLNYYEKFKCILDVVSQNISLFESRRKFVSVPSNSVGKPFLHLPFDTLTHLQCGEDEKVSRKLQVVCLNYCSFRVTNYQSTYLMYNS